MKFMRVGVATFAGLLLASGLATAQSMATGANSAPVAAFTLVAPNGLSPSGLVARAIVDRGNGCPFLNVTNIKGEMQSVEMRERSAPATTGAAFSAFTSCSAHIPVGAKTAQVGSTFIPAAMPSKVRKLAIFGDTGCRVKANLAQQCGDANSWPLAKISSSIAKDKPDLIVFTGDFFYREAACASTLIAQCAGSPAPVQGMPFNDTAYAWAADVFTPMSPIFSTAPILVTRGNHEACNRGGNGYFIYMDPRDGSQNTCAPYTGPDGALTVPANDLNQSYASDVSIDAKHTLRFVVVDSAYGDDCNVSSIYDTQRARYLAAANLAKKQNSWLIVHRPIVGWQVNDDCSPTGGWVSSDQSAASAGLLGNYQILVSSHVHVVEAINIPGIPGQLVIGNGGTLLDPVLGAISTTSGPSTPQITYGAPTSSWMSSQFGYVIGIPKSSTQWDLQMRNPAGATFALCALKSKNIACSNK